MEEGRRKADAVSRGPPRSAHRQELCKVVGGESPCPSNINPDPCRGLSGPRELDAGFRATSCSDLSVCSSVCPCAWAACRAGAGIPCQQLHTCIRRPPEPQTPPSAAPGPGPAGPWLRNATALSARSRGLGTLRSVSSRTSALVGEARKSFVDSEASVRLLLRCARCRGGTVTSPSCLRKEEDSGVCGRRQTQTPAGKLCVCAAGHVQLSHPSCGLSPSEESTGRRERISVGYKHLELALKWKLNQERGKRLLPESS
nr:uncharacterized protein LOC116280291 [Vicugna pacos]